MKNLIPAVFILLLFLTSCKDKEPTAPEDNGTPSEILAETTIGPEGGILETEDFKLTVPSGAFSTSAELKLYVEPAGEYLSEVAVSQMFTVGGIPKDIKKPLSISLKYSGTLTGINYVAVAAKDTVQLIDTSFVDFIYDLFEAEESDGFLSCEIDINPLNKVELSKINNDEDLNRIIIAFTNGKTGPAGDHFTINGSYPDTYEIKVNTIVELLEQAYTRFKDAGFDYSGIENNRIELEIITSDKNSAQAGSSTSPDPEIKLNIYNTEITNLLRSQIVGAFLALVLKRSANNRYVNNIHNTIPFAAWAAFQYDASKYKKRNYVQALLLSGYYDNTFSYIISSYLIEYIANNYGEKKVGQISRIEKSLPLAVVDVMENPKDNEWLNKFYEYLIVDDMFNEYSNSFFINNCSAELDVIDNNTTKYVHSYNYSAQSSTLFHLGLNSPFNENTKLKFKTDNTISGISVIKYKTGVKREVIKSGYGALTVTGIKQLADEGYNLFAIVTNNEYDPPEKTSQITLTIEKNNELLITGCSVFLRYLTAKFTEKQTNGEPTTYTGSLGAGFPKDTDTARVNYNSSNYTLTQEYVGHIGADNQSYTEKIVIKFGDEDWSYISSLSADWEAKGSLGTYKNSLSAITIPLDNTVSFTRFRLGGEDLCGEGKIISLYTFEDHGTYTKTLIDKSWECNENSELVVYISTE